MMDRPISQLEAQIVEWLLSNALIDGSNPPVHVDPRSLRVIGGCACGCVSLDFTDAGEGRVVADAIARYPDGKRAGLMLWATDGAITALEVYDLDPDASHRTPEREFLRPWAAINDSA